MQKTCLRWDFHPFPLRQILKLGGERIRVRSRYLFHCFEGRGSRVRSRYLICFFFFFLRGEGTGSVLVTSSIAEDRGTSSTLSSFTYREGEVGSGSVASLPSLLCICVAGSCCMLVRGLGSKISC
ncbi:hypothetical protein P9112_007717 [Eukaryota sp. TZLM1-RC]